MSSAEDIPYASNGALTVTLNSCSAADISHLKMTPKSVLLHGRCFDGGRKLKTFLSGGIDTGDRELAMSAVPCRPKLKTNIRQRLLTSIRKNQDRHQNNERVWPTAVEPSLRGISQSCNVSAILPSLRPRVRRSLRDQVDSLSKGRCRLRQRAEQEKLARSQTKREREEVLAYLYRSNQRERLRLARDLHDHAGQHTTSLRLEISRPRQHLSTSAGLLMLTSVIGRLDALSTDLHRVATELRPTALQDCGLVGSIQALVADWQDSNIIHARFEILGVEAALSEEAGITLFRLAQECLTNVSKHATGASWVQILLAFTRDSAALTVQDDGVGFHLGPNLVRDLLHANRFGIVGMKERVALVGGDFSLTSVPGAGTRIHAHVPHRSRLT